MKLVHLVGFITKKFVTMHGHMNVKYLRTHLHCIALDFTEPAIHWHYVI